MTGIVQNIIGMVRDINDRKKSARVDDAIRKNWMTSPDVAVQEAIQIDPDRGFDLEDRVTSRATAADTQRRARTKANLDFFTRSLRGAPEGSDLGALVDSNVELYKQNGATDDDIAGFRKAVTTNPSLLQGLDDETYEAVAKDRYGNTVLTPGSISLRGGKVNARAPFAPKTYTLKSADGNQEAHVFNPEDYIPDDEQANRAAPRRGIDPEGPAVAPPGGGDPADLEQQATAVVGRVLQGQRASPKGVQAISQSEARTMQQAWGGGAAGKERFNSWAKTYGVRVVPDGQAPAPMPMERVQPAPTMRANQTPSGPIARTTGVKPVADKRVRAASPEEIQAAGYPKGTAAQIDSNGRLVNLKTPPANTQDSAAIRYKREKDAEAYVAKARGVDQSFGRLEGAAKRLMEHPGMEGATGVIDSMLPNVMVGQQATNFRKELETLRNNIGLSILQDFKSQSSQGASGFGNLSNAEGERLERAFGTLAEETDPSVIKRTLREIIGIAAEKRRIAQETLERGGPPTAGGSTIPVGTVARNKNGAELVWNGTQWVRKGKSK